MTDALESRKDKAEVLNDFFVSVFTKENLSIIPTLPDRNTEIQGEGLCAVKDP